jgi:hypothetical protein
MKTRYIAITIVCFALSNGLCQAVPTIVNAQAAQHQTALNLAVDAYGNNFEGCQLYVYGMTTGGALQSHPFAEGGSVHVEDASGNTSAEISVTTKSSNSFTTDCSYYVIGGFGASDFLYAKGFYGANPGPGPNLQASVRFTLSAPAMVAVIGVGSSQTILTFSGIDPLTIDVPSPNGAAGTEALSIAHTYLGAGTYTIKATTGDGAPIQDPNHEADLLGVLIFSDSPSIAKSDSPEIPLSLSSQPPPTPTVTISNAPPSPPSKPATSMPITRYVMLGIAILVFIALAVAVIRLIMPRRSQ